MPAEFSQNNDFAVDVLRIVDVDFERSIGALTNKPQRNSSLCTISIGPCCINDEYVGSALCA